LLDVIQCFEFAFHLHLTKMVLGITNDLSQALQRKDQDIVNAMNLFKFSKHRLQKMRVKGWQSLLREIFLFCDKHHIIIPNMLGLCVIRGRSRRNVEESMNLHHYRVEVFYVVINMQLQELNNRFNEVNTELLLCISCLSLADSFSVFDKRKLIQFAEFYKSDFLQLS